MDSALNDKTVLVTGASGGIGRALAEAFLGEGSRVALHGHGRFDELEAWAAALPDEVRARTLCLAADITDADAMEALVARVGEAWGRLDVCVANAGVWPPEDVPLHAMDPERFRRTVEIDLLGAAWTARAFLRLLAATGPRADGHGASLTFVGSTAGVFGERHHGDYAAAKSGLVGLTETLKHEIVDLDPYGRVNRVDPGWTVTHMARPALDRPGTIRRVTATMPLRQLARAKDIARTVLWMSSPALARHVTGQTVVVAGGMEGRLRWSPEEIDEDAVRARLRAD